MADRYRPRRSCLSVPASSERFIAKARDLPADEVFLDLEDAVACDAIDVQVRGVQGFAGHRLDRIPPEFLELHVSGTRARGAPFLRGSYFGL